MTERWPRALPTAAGASPAATVLLLLALLYTAYFARTLLVPITLALLLGLVLAPAVRALQSIGIPKAASAAMLVALLFGAVGAGLWALAAPAAAWFERAPQLVRQLEVELYPLRETVRDVSEAAKQVESIAGTEGSPTVEVAGSSLRGLIYSHTRGLLVGVVSVLFLLYFFLAWGGVLMRRMESWLRIEGHETPLREIGRNLQVELSRYLATITLINVALGVVVTVALFALGMPNPPLWGVMAGLLNFAPYVGPFVSLVVITIVAMLTFDTLVQTLLPPATFLLLTSLEGQLITPSIVGRRLALNPLVVFVSIVFWMWLWGIAGALMAVPILAALKIAGDRIENLHPVARVLGR